MPLAPASQHHLSSKAPEYGNTVGWQSVGKLGELQDLVAFGSQAASHKLAILILT